MQLTAEQATIVEAQDPVFKVNAVAGSGKTTTLMAFAARRPDKRILYLAYNRAIAAEVREKARHLPNVRVTTMHGLAYRYTGADRFELTHDLSEWRLSHYVPTAHHGSNSGLLYAWLLKDLVGFYLNDAGRSLDIDLLQRYKTISVLADAVNEILVKEDTAILNGVRRILTDMRQQRLPAVHDFYLKLFQFMPVRLPYDIILVDEAQDTSGVMLSIISRQTHTQRVFVGDGFQQIYAFRHAVNSLDCVTGKAYWLSQTFRFGDKFAQHLGQRVNDAYQIIGQCASLKIRGTDANTRFGHRVPLKRYPLTVIARSNVSLFDTVLKYLSDGVRTIHFEGGYPSYAFLNARVVGLIYLLKGQRQRVSDPLIAGFRSFDEVCRYAKHTQNRTLALMTDLVGRYETRLFEVDKAIRARLTDKVEAQVTFSTTHKAKGQEYEHVQMVEGDFATRNDLSQWLQSEAQSSNRTRLKEEVNVYYVAATRARSSILLATF